MKPRFIVVDQACAQELIQDRHLQSTEFSDGRSLALWLIHGVPNDVETPRFCAVGAAQGLFFLIPNQSNKNALVIDYENAPIFDNLSEADALLVLQRLLRFVVKYWTRGDSRHHTSALFPTAPRPWCFRFHTANRRPSGSRSSVSRIRSDCRSVLI